MTNMPTKGEYIEAIMKKRDDIREIDIAVPEEIRKELAESGKDVTPYVSVYFTNGKMMVLSLLELYAGAYTEEERVMSPEELADTLCRVIREADIDTLLLIARDTIGGEYTYNIESESISFSPDEFYGGAFNPLPSEDDKISLTVDPYSLEMDLEGMEEAIAEKVSEETDFMVESFEWELSVTARLDKTE